MALTAVDIQNQISDLQEKVKQDSPEWGRIDNAQTGLNDAIRKKLKGPALNTALARIQRSLLATQEKVFSEEVNEALKKANQVLGTAAREWKKAKAVIENGEDVGAESKLTEIKRLYHATQSELSRENKELKTLPGQLRNIIKKGGDPTPVLAHLERNISSVSTSAKALSEAIAPFVKKLDAGVMLAIPQDASLDEVAEEIEETQEENQGTEPEIGLPEKEKQEVTSDAKEKEDKEKAKKEKEDKDLSELLHEAEEEEQEKQKKAAEQPKTTPESHAKPATDVSAPASSSPQASIKPAEAEQSAPKGAPLSEPAVKPHNEPSQNPQPSPQPEQAPQHPAPTPDLTKNEHPVPLVEPVKASSELSPPVLGSEEHRVKADVVANPSEVVLNPSDIQLMVGKKAEPQNNVSPEQGHPSGIEIAAQPPQASPQAQPAAPQESHSVSPPSAAPSSVVDAVNPPLSPEPLKPNLAQAAGVPEQGSVRPEDVQMSFHEDPAAPAQKPTAVSDDSVEFPLSTEEKRQRELFILKMELAKAHPSVTNTYAHHPETIEQLKTTLEGFKKQAENPKTNLKALEGEFVSLLQENSASKDPQTFQQDLTLFNQAVILVKRADDLIAEQEKAIQELGNPDPSQAKERTKILEDSVKTLKGKRTQWSEGFFLTTWDSEQRLSNAARDIEESRKAFNQEIQRLKGMPPADERSKEDRARAQNARNVSEFLKAHDARSSVVSQEKEPQGVFPGPATVSPTSLGHSDKKPGRFSRMVNAVKGFFTKKAAAVSEAAGDNDISSKYENDVPPSHQLPTPTKAPSLSISMSILPDSVPLTRPASQTQNKGEPEKVGLLTRLGRRIGLLKAPYHDILKNPQSAHALSVGLQEMMGHPKINPADKTMAIEYLQQLNRELSASPKLSSDTLNAIYQEMPKKLNVSTDPLLLGQLVDARNRLIQDLERLTQKSKDNPGKAQAYAEPLNRLEGVKKQLDEVWGKRFSTSSDSLKKATKILENTLQVSQRAEQRIDAEPVKPLPSQENKPSPVEQDVGSQDQAREEYTALQHRMETAINTAEEEIAKNKASLARLQHGMKAMDKEDYEEQELDPQKAQKDIKALEERTLSMEDKVRQLRVVLQEDGARKTEGPVDEVNALESLKASGQNHLTSLESLTSPTVNKRYDDLVKGLESKLPPPPPSSAPGVEQYDEPEVSMPSYDAPPPPSTPLSSKNIKPAEENSPVEVSKPAAATPDENMPPVVQGQAQSQGKDAEPPQKNGEHTDTPRQKSQTPPSTTPPLSVSMPDIVTPQGMTHSASPTNKRGPESSLPGGPVFKKQRQDYPAANIFQLTALSGATLSSGKAHEGLYRSLLNTELSTQIPSGAAFFKQAIEVVKQESERIKANAEKGKTLKKDLQNLVTQGDKAEMERFIQTHLGVLDDKKLSKEGFSVGKIEVTQSKKGLPLESFKLRHKANKLDTQETDFASVAQNEGGGATLKFNKSEPGPEEIIKGLKAFSAFATGRTIEISEATPKMAGQIFVQLMASGQKAALSDKVLSELAKPENREVFIAEARKTYEAIMEECSSASVSVEMDAATRERKLVKVETPAIAAQMKKRLGDLESLEKKMNMLVERFVDAQPKELEQDKDKRDRRP